MLVNEDAFWFLALFEGPKVGVGIGSTRRLVVGAGVG